MNSARQQEGAVLVVSLLLLLVITLVGISNFSTTLLEEKMTSNFQDKNMVFQAADTAIEEGMEDTNFLWKAYQKGVGPSTPEMLTVTDAGAYFSKNEVAAEFESNTADVGEFATSIRMGSSGYQLFHYSIEGTAELSDSNARSVNVMGAYLKGPSAN